MDFSGPVAKAKVEELLKLVEGTEVNQYEVLILRGPSGSCKKTTLLKVCDFLGANVREFDFLKRRGYQPLIDEENFMSMTDSFLTFLQNCLDYQPLKFSNQSDKKSGRKVLNVCLLAELPCTLIAHKSNQFVQKFQILLTNWFSRSSLGNINRRNILVVLCTDSSFEIVSKLFSINGLPYTSNHQIKELVFNPITNAKVRDVLLCDRKIDRRPSNRKRKAKTNEEILVDRIIDTSKGDLRTALNTLHFYSDCTIGDSSLVAHLGGKDLDSMMYPILCKIMHCKRLPILGVPIVHPPTVINMDCTSHQYLFDICGGEQLLCVLPPFHWTQLLDFPAGAADIYMSSRLKPIRKSNDTKSLYIIDRSHDGRSPSFTFGSNTAFLQSLQQFYSAFIRLPYVAAAVGRSRLDSDRESKKLLRPLSDVECTYNKLGRPDLGVPATDVLSSGEIHGSRLIDSIFTCYLPFFNEISDIMNFTHNVAFVDANFRYHTIDMQYKSEILIRSAYDSNINPRSAQINNWSEVSNPFSCFKQWKDKGDNAMRKRKQNRESVAKQAYSSLNESTYGNWNQSNGLQRFLHDSAFTDILPSLCGNDFSGDNLRSKFHEFTKESKTHNLEVELDTLSEMITMEDASSDDEIT